ncbi:C-C motif chemokine 21b-like [Elgaria multicarinata webbii]|uniref:C-C motif chemokine 21b-like n=1 Tax=Elgaria multicarinata webbii TaxID=159646 RepID=UPI002FCD449E
MALRSVIASCLLAAALCILQAQGRKSSSVDCCEAVKDVRLEVGKMSRFQSYVLQEPAMGCPISAIVLITKKGRGLCYPPNSRWALALKNALDQREARKARRSQA